MNSFSYHGRESRAMPIRVSQRKNSKNKWDWYYKTGLKLTLPMQDQEPGKYVNFYWKQGAYHLEIM